MASPPIHMDRGDADHIQWSLDAAEDSFDSAALEEAMLEARQVAYQALRALDAA